MAGISITLAGNFEKLDELKDKAQKAAAGIKSAFGSNIGKAMFAGIATAATAAFAAVTVAMKSAIDAGGELSDVMARTGADGAKLFVLGRAFENAGMSASQVPAALNKMQKALAGLNEEGEPTSLAFAKLGLSIGQLSQMDPADAFRATAEAIAGIEDPAKRTAAAMEIFGKSGGELLVVMTDSKAFANASEQVGGLAQTLADNANAFDGVSDSLGLMEVKMQQLGAEVAVSLLPLLTQFSEWVNETDLSSVGSAIGIMAEKTVGFVSTLSDLAEYMPLMIAFRKLADMGMGGGGDPVKAAAMREEWEKNDPMRGKSRAAVAAQKTADGQKAQAEADALLNAKTAEKEAAAAEKAAGEAQKKAEAEAKIAAEKAKSRGAAEAEHDLEMAILSARLAGDAQRLESLEREKKIRAEMKRMESAGFNEAEGRSFAESRVDTEKRAEEKEEERKRAADEKKRVQDILLGKLDDVGRRMQGQQFGSTLGSVSQMQRIGGGGGAVGSGLDYARQTADLQREANGLTRQVIELLRPVPDV